MGPSSSQKSLPMLVIGSPKSEIEIIDLVDSDTSDDVQCSEANTETQATSAAPTVSSHNNMPLPRTVQQRIEPEQNEEEKCSYLVIEVRGAKLELIGRLFENTRYLKNSLAWEIIQTWLSFFHSNSEEGSRFLNEDSLLELMAIFEHFDQRLTGNLGKEVFFFV